MQVTIEHLNCAEQLGEAAEAELQLKTLREHQRDSVSTFERALVSANRLDEAATLLLSRLADPDQRLDALMSVQQYASTSLPPRAEVLSQRWQRVLAQAKLRQAILELGTLESDHVRKEDH
jgi:hypothetical protein